MKMSWYQWENIAEGCRSGSERWEWSTSYAAAVRYGNIRALTKKVGSSACALMASSSSFKVSPPGVRPVFVLGPRAHTSTCAHLNSPFEDSATAEIRAFGRAICWVLAAPAGRPRRVTIAMPRKLPTPRTDGCTNAATAWHRFDFSN